jgi:hypothetical protein
MEIAPPIGPPPDLRVILPTPNAFPLSPAVSEIDPAVELAEPPFRIIEPALFAVTVSIVMEPEVEPVSPGVCIKRLPEPPPDIGVPVAIVTAPEEPAVEFPDLRVTAPDVALETLPLDIETEPDVAEAVTVLPLLSTTLPLVPIPIDTSPDWSVRFPPVPEEEELPP